MYLPKTPFEKPVFIVCCTNTGSKVLQQLLFHHTPLGGTTIEPHFMGIAPNHAGRISRLFALYPSFNSIRLYERTRFFEAGPISKENAETTYKAALNQLDEKLLVEGNRALIKEPKFSLRIPWLLDNWPDCKIIILTRNPVDVCEGIVRRLPIHGDVPLTMDIPTAVAQYNTVYNTIDLDIKKLPSSNNICRICFEDILFHSCTEKHLLSFLKKLADFIETPIVLRKENEYLKYSKPEKKFAPYHNSKNLTQWEIDYIEEYAKLPKFHTLTQI